MSRVTTINAALFFLYIVLMATVVWGMFAMRGWTERTYSTTVAQGEWQDFRDAVSDAVEEGGPVRRTVPKSEQPPGLVLLRDYFAQCLTIAVVLTSALFMTFAFMVRGVTIPDESDPENEPS